jgi:hypothetical protein
VTRIRTARPGDVDQCIGVLASLPDYFTPDRHESARRGLSDHRGWVATRGGEVIGFVLVERRYPTTAEITFAAVLRESTSPRSHRPGSGGAVPSPRSSAQNPRSVK